MVRRSSGIFTIRSDRPAARIQQVLENEAAQRASRGYPLWCELELLAVWNATNAERQLLGKPPVALESVRRAESSASGHIDYSVKLALYCEELVNE